MSLTEDRSATPTPLPGDAPSLSDSIYQSAYLQADERHLEASLYHSAIDPFQDIEDFVEDFDSEGAVDAHKVGVAKERRQRKSAMSRERQFCAQLSINEVLLSISSRGECSDKMGGLLCF